MALTDYISVPLALSVVVAGFTCFLVSHWRKNRNLPPGPWGLPFLGYYPFISEEPFRDFAKLAAKYGDVFSFRSAGGSLFVVVNGTKAIKDTLVNRADEFIGKPLESNFLDWLSDGLGVTQEEGSTWKEHRRYFLHTAKNFGFGKLEIESTVHDEIRNLKEDLLKTNGQPIDLGVHLDYVINTVIMKIMFARKIDKDGPIFRKLSQVTHNLLANIADNRLMLVGIPFRLSMWLRPWSVKVRQGRAFLKSIVQNIIEEHVRTFDPNNLRDYTDSYLYEMQKQKKNGEPSSFTKDRLLAIAMNMTMEGSGGDTICSLLVQASRRPEEQKKVQEELDAVIGREAMPSWLDKKRLPYLEAFIQELFRTAQAFPMTTHYSNFEETTINGYRIPKRSILVGNLWSINNDPDIYENPTEFDVNRFLNEGEKKIRTDGPYPFSMGKRSCVGQSLAQMEIFLIISSVLQSFTLLPSDKKGVVRAIPRD